MMHSKSYGDKRSLHRGGPRSGTRRSFIADTGIASDKLLLRFVMSDSVRTSPVLEKVLGVMQLLWHSQRGRHGSLRRRSAGGRTPCGNPLLAGFPKV